MIGKSRVLVVGMVGVVLAAVVAGYGSGVAEPFASAAVRQASPACSSTNLPAWSPDGKQIAFVGRRLHHGPLPVRAICVANADGKQAAPLPRTVCTRRCRLDLIDSPTQLFWVQPNLLLYGDDFRIFTIPVGGTPEPLGKQPGSFEQFSVDSAGDRVAAGFSSCPQCAGPVTVLSVPSGALVGRVGGKKLDNITPSISPDGKQVVFVRSHGDSPRSSIWTASADGSHLRRLERAGGSPLWSPDGGKIAYLRGKAPNWPALLLVSPHGGKSTTLIRGAPCPSVGRCRSNGVMALFGWSPDASRIAFENARQRLEVVDVATGKMRSLLKLRFGPSVAWSPDSQELLVRTQPRAHNRCASLWRVPVGGGKPQLLRNC
jgi:Tol biopolymer transport system component